MRQSTDHGKHTNRRQRGDGHSPAAYTIDSPPPTISGELHIGHLYMTVLQDIVARYRSMTDGGVYFPLGFDDNGIASERLAEIEQAIAEGAFSISDDTLSVAGLELDSELYEPVIDRTFETTGDVRELEDAVIVIKQDRRKR